MTIKNRLTKVIGKVFETNAKVQTNVLEKIGNLIDSSTIDACIVQGAEIAKIWHEVAEGRMSFSQLKEEVMSPENLKKNDILLETFFEEFDRTAKKCVVFVEEIKEEWDRPLPLWQDERLAFEAFMKIWDSSKEEEEEYVLHEISKI